MRPASILMRNQIKLLQSVLCEDVESARRAQDKAGELGAKVLLGKVRFLPRFQSPFRADWAVPEAPDEYSAILYLHGGGYTAGSLEYARGFGGILADLTQRSVLCVGYRLAPEHPFPAALDDALTAYRSMLRDYAPERIALVGESAGGGLCYALCLKLAEEGLPVPACIVALSPWTDLTLSLPAHQRNKELDPTLSDKVLGMYADMYAPSDKQNPLVSPLLGDLRKMPPSLIFAGTHEILEDDAREMHRRLLEAGCESALHVEEGGWHVYVLYGVYEGRQALARIRKFIEERIGFEEA